MFHLSCLSRARGQSLGAGGGGSPGGQLAILEFIHIRDVVLHPREALGIQNANQRMREVVFGPVVHHLASLDSINTSNERIVSLVQGKWKEAVPDTGTFAWVDVRDVALAHVLALEKPELGGKRLFTTAGYFSNR